MQKNILGLSIKSINYIGLEIAEESGLDVTSREQTTIVVLGRDVLVAVCSQGDDGQQRVRALVSHRRRKFCLKWHLAGGGRENSVFGMPET